MDLSDIKTITEGMVILTILPTQHRKEMNCEILKMLTQEHGHHGAYVSLNQPYHNLIADFGRSGINHGKVFFLDCVSERGHDADNVVYLQGFESLTHLSLALEHIYKNSDMAFIFLDSIDALTIYHKTDYVLQFCRSLIERMREHEKKGIMIGLREDIDHHIIDELSLVCDKVIDMSTPLNKI